MDSVALQPEQWDGLGTLPPRGAIFPPPLATLSGDVGVNARPVILYPWHLHRVCVHGWDPWKSTGNLHLYHVSNLTSCVATELVGPGRCAL